MNHELSAIILNVEANLKKRKRRDWRSEMN